jgi:uncharacterized protein
VALASGLTGAEIARRILRDQGIQDVQVVEHQGFLSDHYNPMEKILALSPDVYHGTHASAAGVAAHEVGHAIQHARGFWHMWLRSILVYPANFGSMLGPILVGVGFFLAGAQGFVEGSAAYALALAGLAFFATATLCSVVIVQNEFNASAQAKSLLLRLGITNPGDQDALHGVVLVAGLTYLAAAITSLLYLAYYAWMIFNQRREE